MMERNRAQTRCRKTITLSQGNPSHCGTVRQSRQTRGIGYIRLKQLLVLVIILLVATPIFAAMISNNVPEPNYETVVVSQGDTLWTIAKRVKPRTDPRKTIYEIRQHNELKSVDLRPGQTLFIPI
jgi:LysM repeat protein